MYVLNVSKGKQVTINERKNIKIIVDFVDFVPAVTICYVILLAPASIVRNEKVTEKI